MPFTIECPGCEALLKLSDSLYGKVVRCARCSEEFVARDTARSLSRAIQKPPRPGAVAPKRKPSNRSSAPPPRPRSSPATTVLIVVLLLFCGVVVAAGSGIAWWVLSSTPKAAASLAESATQPNAVEAPPEPKPEDPPKLEEPAPPPGGNPDTIPLDMLQFIKAATVFVKADAPGSSASGSGFILQVEGDSAYVVTNHHVIAPHVEDVSPFPLRPPPLIRPGFRPPPFPGGLTRRRSVHPAITLVFRSGTPRESAAKAEVVADDAEKDLAILKTAVIKNLPKPINTARKARLVETMPVYIFGFPFGKALAINKGNPAITIGKGAVSSLRLDAHGEMALVQIDGDLNPGNSGGPVVDTNGRLVGVSVARIRDSRIGLAIPPGDLDKLVSGRPNALTLARRTLRGDVVAHVGETWPLDVHHRVATTRAFQEAAPDDQQHNKPADDAVAEIVVEAKLFDPLSKVPMAAVHYLKSELLGGPVAEQNGVWSALPNAQKVGLILAEHKGTATLKIPVIRKDDAYYFQLSYRNGNGQVFYTQPRLFHLDRAAAPAPVVVPPPPPPPVNPVEALPPQPEAKKKYTEAELTQLLADLKSTDFFRKNGALEKLRGAEVIAARRSEVARALEAVLAAEQHNPFIRRNATSALGMWGDAKSVPVLIERFGPDEKDVFLKQGAIEAVGLLKDEKGAEAVSCCLGDFFLRGHAIKSLKTMGSMAEKPVLKLLKHADVNIRIEACKLLMEIGTKASVAALEAASADSNPNLVKAAADALKAVAGK